MKFYLLIKFNDSYQCVFIDALWDGVSEFKVDDIPNIIKALNKILALKKGIDWFPFYGLTTY